MPALEPAKALVRVRPSQRIGADDEPARARCRDACDYDAGSVWHDTLTRVESDSDALLDLMELALTWHELEYSETTTLSPDQWPSFMECHHWDDPDRAERIFSIAADVVRTAGRATTHRTGTPDRPEEWQRGCLDSSGRRGRRARSTPVHW